MRWPESPRQPSLHLSPASSVGSVPKAQEPGPDTHLAVAPEMPRASSPTIHAFIMGQVQLGLIPRVLSWEQDREKNLGMRLLFFLVLSGQNSQPLRGGRGLTSGVL